MSLNTLILTGNLGSDPKVTLTTTGKKKASFSLATNRVCKGQRQTEWTSVVLWGGLALRAEKLLSKGQSILVQGEKRSRVYTDSTGAARQIVELVATDFHLVGHKKPSIASEDSVQ